MPRYDRLSTEDTSFLYMESPVNHMNVGALMLFEDSGATVDELRAHIESRLHKVPRFRKRLMWVPFGAGRPIWVDDENFDIRYHVRHAGVAAPGGMKELTEMFGRLLSIPLDRSKPLWEIWLIDLPGQNKRAAIQKTHHCLIDGVSGVDVLTILLDITPETPPEEKHDWKPQPPPSKLQLVKDSLKEKVLIPSEIANSVREAVKVPFDYAEELLETSEGIIQFLRDSVFEPAPVTSLCRQVGSHRRFTTAEIKLADVKTVRKAARVKINDVMLALSAGALRHFFTKRGEKVDNMELHVMVPVSVRSSDHRKTFGNEVSAMYARLPVGETDPKERLKKVASWMEKEKSTHEPLGAKSIIQFGDFAPPTLLSLASRIGVSSSGKSSNFVVTNVPGPQFPLYSHGGKLLAGYPYVGPVGTMSISIAVISYDGNMYFGLGGDWDTVPDLEVISEGLEKSMAELVEAYS